MRHASLRLASALAALVVGSTLQLPVMTRAQVRPGLALPAEAIRLIEAHMAEKAQRTPAQRKVSSRLLHEQRVRRGAAIPGDASLRRTIEVATDGTVLVDIRTEVTSEVLALIEASGGAVVNAVPAYDAVRARLPLESVETVAARPEVRFVGPADQATTQAQIARRPGGSDAETSKVDTSQGDIAHRAALARSLYGVTGAGIGIGVLSDGVNTLAARQASGDLPAVTVLPGQAGSGDEGTAMLEIVYDLAPGSPLFFATALGGQAQFAANIQALCSAGAKVIVDDVFYFAEAVFQDGIVAAGVNAASASGCIYFSSAGNSGNKNDGTSGVWEGDFVAAGSTPGAIIGTAHDFGGANSNQITVDSPSQFSLKWSDAQGASANDYDLYLFNPTLTTIFDASTNLQNGTQDPIEAISSVGFNDVNNRLVIVRFSGSARYLHLTTNRGRLAISTSGQTGGHAGAKNAFGVAAVDVATASGGAFIGGAANPVETYSSDGLRRIFYQPNGTAITPGNFLSTGGELVQKPDLAAADCVSTSTPGFTTFCGTSAAAPHAAAIAALMLQAVPSLTRAALKNAIDARAFDIEAFGMDRDSGVGIVDALGAVGRTHPAFTNNPLVAGVTTVKAVHVSELRNRINAQRVRCGLSQFAFTDPILTAGVTPLKVVHIAQMRTALDLAYFACGVLPPGYPTDPVLTANVTLVKAAHISDIRAVLLALE